MENESTERGVSISEFWRIAKRKFFPILLISLLAAAIAVFVFTLFINPRTSSYTLEFTLTYPGVLTQKYPDGTIFYYQDIVSSDALSVAKESDARFNGIDVRAMIEGDDISIERTEDSYLLSVQQSYFSSRSDATAFLRTLAHLPIETVKQKACELDFSLSKAVFDSVTFGDKLDLLKNQKDGILQRLDEWIAGYSEDYVVAGKSLKNYRMEASVALGDVVYRELMKDLDVYGNVSRDSLSVRISELSKERELNEKKIGEVKAMLESVRATSYDSGEMSSGLAEIVAELLMRNVEIDREIEALTEENLDAFEARVNAEYEKVQKAASSVQAVAQVLYEQESRANFSTTNSLSEGSTSAILVGVGVFIIAFLIVSAIVCAAGLPKLRAEEAARARQKAEGSEAEVQPSGEEPQRQKEE